VRSASRCVASSEKSLTPLSPRMPFATFAMVLVGPTLSQVGIFAISRMRFPIGLARVATITAKPAEIEKHLFDGIGLDLPCLAGGAVKSPVGDRTRPVIEMRL